MCPDNLNVPVTTCTCLTPQLHTYLAANVLKKPVVIEEFGLTWFKKTPAQQRVLFQVITIHELQCVGQQSMQTLQLWCLGKAPRAWQWLPLAEHQGIHGMARRQQVPGVPQLPTSCWPVTGILAYQAGVGRWLHTVLLLGLVDEAFFR